MAGATGIGVGAMIGGGILALAGVAFSVTGPSAILAFLLNGLIALITALSFAEMAAAHPQSGGAYTFAKKALTVNVAFGVGWVVWFASIVAAVLYALGFGAFAAFALVQFFPDASWIEFRPAVAGLALLALLFYTRRLSKVNPGGGLIANIVKVLVFAILIAGGLAVFVQTPISHVKDSLQPFFAEGFTGLLAAMGYSFIALQGFDLIASASGEIKKPEKTIPKAMIATLVIGLLIYIPLLFFVSTVGVMPGENIQGLSAQNPETAIAIAAQNFMGSFGFWFVIIAGIFSMLSALQANVFAASRISLAMAVDRTLPHQLSYINPKNGTPTKAIFITTGIVALLIVLLPGVAAAGAASSMIFLITFALAQGINILMRKRSFGSKTTFRVPMFPVLPIFGMAACLALALFQAVAVPSAGVIALGWLCLGSILFVVFFIQRARVIDASEEALDPNLVRLRGLSPLVLVPVANPGNAGAMVFVASALAPPQVGRVLLLSIVTATESGEDIPKRLEGNQNALHQGFTASFASGLKPDALITIANEPWEEILRVVRVHRCRSILLGLSSFSDLQTTGNLEKLVASVSCDVVVFRQPHTGWDVRSAKKILVPVGGTREHDALRARVLGSLWRTSQPEITFLQMIPTQTSAENRARIEKDLTRFAGRIIPGKTGIEVLPASDVAGELVNKAKDYDLVVMGLGRVEKGQRAFGHITLKLASETGTALLLISHKV